MSRKRDTSASSMVDVDAAIIPVSMIWQFAAYVGTAIAVSATTLASFVHGRGDDRQRIAAMVSESFWRGRPGGCGRACCRADHPCDCQDSTRLSAQSGCDVIEGEHECASELHVSGCRIALSSRQDGQRKVPGGVGPDGDIVAFSTLCTHMGCPVAYDSSAKTFKCPCHFSQFDPEIGGQMICGQATENLPQRRCSSVTHRRLRSPATGVEGLIYGRQANVL